MKVKAAVIATGIVGVPWIFIGLVLMAKRYPIINVGIGWLLLAVVVIFMARFSVELWRDLYEDLE